MITWEAFFESKEKKDIETVEKAEEILGKDLDNDKEAGESKAHKKKVLKKESCMKSKKCKKSKKM